MSGNIDDQVIDFYQNLFQSIFWDAFESEIRGRLKRNAVKRGIEESADAASQSLIRFVLNRRLEEEQVAFILAGLARLGKWTELEDATNPNVPPETLAQLFESGNPCPEAIQQAGIDAEYRVSLDAVIQVITLVGPVIAEWRRTDFSRNFELLDRVIDRLNEISARMGALAESAQDVEDERFELSYRDYLLQRFFRVEAGTVRMTTNMNIDLRELFVMPEVLPRPKLRETDILEDAGLDDLMDLAAARGSFQNQDKQTESRGLTALDQVLGNKRTVIVGTPGGGKSTFLEWLQLRIANADQEMILGDQQAIPLLLRVRQMDAHDLPRGAALIAKATASKDRARLMPEGWIERQLESGHVLLLIDGLDETDSALRTRYVLPWLNELCARYPDCAFVVSSRLAGYPRGMLGKLGFVECDLQDFDRSRIEEYCRHWCTAVRLAQNEPEKESRREGQAEGAKIVADFEQHPYIRDLARNPLMLSAICLVNYFEAGQLPNDRAKLYQLCVEGLLHHWDQRRGIHSEFSLEEKLRVCREVAIAMQADGLAEYEDSKVESILADVLGDTARADMLLQHIRYRTGLLIERRAKVYAFAHLTFQEYLAACAVQEGNRCKINAEQLAKEFFDSRWKEVIALYCGLAPTPASRAMVQQLISKDDMGDLASLLADAYLSSGQELAKDQELRAAALKRIATAPARLTESALDRFPDHEVAQVANSLVGLPQKTSGATNSCWWLTNHTEFLDGRRLMDKLHTWSYSRQGDPTELIYLAHKTLPYSELYEVMNRIWPYAERSSWRYRTQAELAFVTVLRPPLGQKRIASESITDDGESLIAKLLQFLVGEKQYSDRFLVDCLYLDEILIEVVKKSEMSALLRNLGITISAWARDSPFHKRAQTNLARLADRLESSV